MADKLKLLDLFSGIGGFSLGLERTGGFETVAFCEIEDFPRRVLAKHWPEVPRYEDIRELNAATLSRDGIEVDAICGGFPCQDISTAGTGAGIQGQRSRLWFEFARLIGELRPQIVFVENSSNLTNNGLDQVCGSLAEIGYDAQWDVISAPDVGAPHKSRARCWILAYPNRKGKLQPQRLFSYFWRRIGDRCEAGDLSHTLRQRQQGQRGAAYAIGDAPKAEGQADWLVHDGGWAAEPNVGRMAHGVPNGMDRNEALGNAVLPIIPEALGNAYLESISWRKAA